MCAKRYQLESYRKHLLNRVTSSSHIIEYIENCVASDDEAANHSFHKIIIHNWTGSNIELFGTIVEYFCVSFIPVNFTSQGGIATFYTSSLTLILKIAKLDFMFPHQRNMFTVDILFNDKTSADLFENRISIADLVSSIVSSRLNERLELDLSNFCNDSEFRQKKIDFYKITLLANFKILMLRIGRDTRALNLSNNNLSQIPAEILNFFIKGDLTSVNLSNNNIPSLQELHRVSSKIEKLWVEGNPLCENLDPVTYVKQITMKFPRLIQLDGVRFNEHGVVIPFYRNYLDSQDKGTKMLVEKFLSLYFAHYDASPRLSIEDFYDPNAKLTISTNFTATEEKTMQHSAKHSRNVLDPKKRLFVVSNHKMYTSKKAICGVLSQFPETVHDPTSFTVDVLKNDKKSLVLIVDGVYKEPSRDSIVPERYFRFRRTWIFRANAKSNTTTEYFITNEMLNIGFAPNDVVEKYFKNGKVTNPLALNNPDPEDSNALCNILCHFTRLKKTEAELLLESNDWDIKKTVKAFLKDLRRGNVTMDKFVVYDEEDDFTDSSSLVEDDGL
ncbi:nuclear RNA export factor 1-like [Hyposmocoma kahamanoa]|uniref:nuclear RNA export factor 1-like n=1 Tax=Hyposmocoma kahamanoa TaxID=1477025 RepID=UPI000E6D9767|nr:nuclear RNA export factor 1-like [Hyposmocoma kahamanoa]